MLPIIHASRHSRHAVRIGVRHSCNSARTVTTRFTTCQRRILLGGGGIGLAGIWISNQRRGNVICETADAATILDSSSHPGVSEELAPSGTKHVRTVSQRKRSWKRLLRMLCRCVVLICKFSPLALVTPILLLIWDKGGEGMFWKVMLRQIDSAGPTFVKLAQWASTRPDLFSASTIEWLSRLQTRTHPHSLQQTSKIFAEAFGADWQNVIKVDPAPVGSGCMGQVYHGWVLGQGAGQEDKEVAVKVRHPGAKEKVELDLDIMRSCAKFLERRWSRLSLFSLSDFVNTFDAFISPQADMIVEASNLDKFNENFPFASNATGVPVRFPEVVRPFLSEAVLVMTYIRATPLTRLFKGSEEEEVAQPNDNLFRAPSRRDPELLHRDSQRTASSRRVGGLCIDAFMQMLFRDKFVHGDMHPGNMLVRFNNDEGQSIPPELVLIDTGLAVQMEPKDQRNFVDLLYAVAKKDGMLAGRLMVERSPGNRAAVVDEDVFVEKIAGLVHAATSKGLSLGKFGIGDMLGQMLQLAYHHRVKLETSFVTVVTSIAIVEGVARQLEPNVDILEAATPYLVKAAAAHAFGRH